MIRRVLGGLLATLVAVLAALAAPVTAGAQDGVQCQPVSMKLPARATLTAPLSLPVPSQDWTIDGRLCAPDGADRVQLLQHGSLFDSRYWSGQGLPDRYDYVEFANDRGWATLNIDRLGNGASTTPLPELVTSGAQVEIAHELVQGLRDGEFGREFSTVAIVGHSYGSGIAAAEAGTFRDVDAAVLTGFTHKVVPGALFPFSTSLAPARVVAGDRLDDRPEPGYLTSRDGLLEDAFFHGPNADPQVIERDEAIRQTITDAEIATFANLEAKTPAITAPVLSVIGNEDQVFCGQMQCSSALNQTQLEEAFYPSAESFDMEIVPEAGHGLNHHRNAQDTFALIHDWLDDRTG